MLPPLPLATINSIGAISTTTHGYQIKQNKYEYKNQYSYHDILLILLIPATRSGVAGFHFLDFYYTRIVCYNE